MGTDYQLGMDCVLYYDDPSVTPATLAPSTMTAAGNVRDLKLDGTTGEADITTRGNSGFKATAATLKECTADFQIVHKDNDAFFAAIRSAWLAGTSLSLAILTAAYNVSGSEGPIGNFSITKFTRDESLENAVVYDVTAKLAAFGRWFANGS